MSQAAQSAVVTPKLAATVILVRDHPDGLAVFMVRRHIRSDFAADVYVFPGGKAEPDDVVPGERLSLHNFDRVAHLEPSRGWRPLVVAAIRELFEESGVLLATKEGNRLRFSDDPNLAARFDRYRDQVRNRELGMAELALEEDLVFSGADLLLFTNWITPPVLSKRFDTFFFIARLLTGQEPEHVDLHELTDSTWIAPSDALVRFQNGDFPLVFATERILGQLSRFRSMEELRRYCTSSSIQSVTPRQIVRGGMKAFAIPGDADY